MQHIKYIHVHDAHTPSFGCIYILKSGITQCTDIDHHRLRSKVKIAGAYSRKYDMDWHRIQEMDKRHAYIRQPNPRQLI